MRFSDLVRRWLSPSSDDDTDPGRRSGIRRSVRAQQALLAEHEVRLNRQLNRLDGFQQTLDGWTAANNRNRVEYNTSSHQLTAIEQRLADLEDVRVDPGDEAARTEARHIVEAVRLEHARIRARLTLLSSFEERLRRVEAALLHAIALETLPTPPSDLVGSDVAAARATGEIAPDATTMTRTPAVTDAP